MQVLAGDIGGTHSRLCLARQHGGRIELQQVRDYPSQDYPELASVVQRFLREAGTAAIDASAFAIAGPVRGRQAQVTNLPWQVEAEEMARRLPLGRVSLLNDFQAIGYGLAQLDSAQLLSLQAGKPETHGVRALIGAGTGLGIGYLVWQDGSYRPFPTEGGHARFAPADREQERLLDFLHASMDYVSWEYLLSGTGLQRIYGFFLEQEGCTSPCAEAIRQAPDPAAAISDYALKEEDEAAMRALNCFVQIYGAQAGNVALNYLPFGGLYIAGGIAPKIIQRLRSDIFMQAFHSRGAMSGLMPDFPVHVVMDARAGLLGAAVFGFYSLSELRQK